MAVPRDGVTAVLIDGGLQLIDTATGQGVWIKTSWYGVLRAAMYDQRGPRISKEERQREVEAQYCDRY
ncbi:MAG: hypothetical protein L0220_16170 [Acidobacteria bacterium]|nr:hypothetical protein [Acidobacteriota bacterium]